MRKGIKVAAMAGAAKHALRHRDVGCDFVIAVGTEAGGHTGSTTSMVLWPRIVDAVAPLPVLGAGGVGRGRQMAAALALGCEGVWCGSVWLKTVESEVTPEIKQKMFEAGSEDAVLTRTVTGKPCRTLRSTLHRRVGPARRAGDAAGAAAGAALVGPGPHARRARAREGVPHLSGRPDRRRHARRDVGAQRRP